MTTQRQIKAPSEALPSDRLSQFIRAGAWAAIASDLALAASLLVEWLVVPFEQLGATEAYLRGSYFLSSGLRLLSTVLFWGGGSLGSTRGRRGLLAPSGCGLSSWLS